MKGLSYSFLRAVCALVIGLVLVMFPNQAGDYFVITIGVIFLVPSLISIIGYFIRYSYLYPRERICYEKTSISGHRLIVCICVTVRSTAGVCLYPLFVRRGTFAEYCHEYSARQKGKYVVCHLGWHQ